VRLRGIYLGAPPPDLRHPPTKGDIARLPPTELGEDTMTDAMDASFGEEIVLNILEMVSEV